MNNRFDNIKGTYDYLPEKQILREQIKHTLESVFVKYGFAPAETPIICKYDLLASKYSEGADILNEMYTLSDQGKRKLGLRYDLTITFSKLISSNPSVVLPFKRYEIGKVFRDGPVKLGRNREFTQCDTDVVGIKSIMAEAEYMTMTGEAYKKLGLDIEIEFNNRKLLSGLIMLIFGELPEEITRKCIMLIDKFAKLTEVELQNEFETIGIDAEKLEILKELLRLDYENLKSKLAVIGTNQLINEGWKEIDELYEYLADCDVLENMKFAPYLARGIDVYTGTVWEVFLKDRKIENQDFNLSIGGGGRYDKIITTFMDDGNEYPAIGMSFGLDVIYEILNLKNRNKSNPIVELFIIPIEASVKSFEFATKLRAVGLKVEIDKTARKLKKSMNFANKMNIPFVVVIGQNEIVSGNVKVKNMSTGLNIEVAMNDIETIKKIVEEK